MVVRLEMLNLLTQFNLLQNSHSTEYATSLRGRGWQKKSKNLGKEGYWSGGGNRSNIIINTPPSGKYIAQGEIMFKSYDLIDCMTVGVLDRFMGKPILKKNKDNWFDWKMNFAVDDFLEMIGVMSIEFYCEAATNERELRQGNDQNMKSFFLSNFSVLKV